MNRSLSQFASLIGPGIVAGMAGTCVMMAMRSFDQKYAPKTVPPAREDPGDFLVSAAARAVHASGSIPKPVEQAASLAAKSGYGALFGVLYGLWRGRGRSRSALVDGTALGGLVYGASYLAWMPAFGVTQPVWKQQFPEIAGELLRHVAYGVATAAAYETIDAL
jgi:uncharacterized membrane protein YagU involved in acid resistance